MDIKRMLEIADESGVIIKSSDNPVHKIVSKTGVYSEFSVVNLNDAYSFIEKENFEYSNQKPDNYSAEIQKADDKGLVFAA